MATGIHKLTALKVDRMKEPGRYADGGGLYLQVSEFDSKKEGRKIGKAWIFRFMLAGKARSMGLGPVHTLTLAEAREKARAARALLLDGRDPINARDRLKSAALADAAKKVTFRRSAEQYINAQRSGWKNEKHGAQWTATLERYAFPVIGDLAIDAVDTGAVMKIIEPMWATKTETASRVRGRIEAVLDWATARGFRTGDNPARWRGHIDKMLKPKTKVRKVKHHDAMPYADVPAFVAGLRENDSVSAKALEFTVLTAARTGETIGALWSEIDTKAKLWTCPGDRTKSGRDHRVPLPDRVLEILAALPREKENDHVFIGARSGKGLSNMAMLELLRGLTENGFTVHGFRSSFRDWVHEQTNYSREIAEAALAHVVGDQTEAAYRRGDALDKRRKLMTAWASYCSSPRRSGNVTQMIRKGA